MHPGFCPEHLPGNPSPHPETLHCQSNGHSSYLSFFDFSATSDTTGHFLPVSVRAAETHTGQLFSSSFLSSSVGSHTLGQGSPNFSVMGQTVNILGFAGPTVFVMTTPLFTCRQKQPQTMYKRMSVAVFHTTYCTKI